MSPVFDKHRLISELSLPPTLLRQASAVANRHHARTVLTIGLVNNMPDAALKSTERQFKGLLRAASEAIIVDLRYFSLPSVKRSRAAQSRIDRLYTSVSELGRLKLDGLIVTGAEPHATSIADEPYWQEFVTLVHWANANTRSTIWSCLAAHAAILHLDGIKRQRLNEKCSGVFECTSVADDWLTRGLQSPFKVSHSRLNEVRSQDLEANGYKILTKSRDVGVDVFAKEFRSHFIFFQGHPEYDPSSLRREYQRDVSRFLTGERDAYPITPSGYFDDETVFGLTNFERRARIERSASLIEGLPPLIVQPSVQASASAKVIFRNWLRYLAKL